MNTYVLEIHLTLQNAHPAGETTPGAGWVGGKGT